MDNYYYQNVLLLHGEGADASTTVTDSSNAPHTLTAEEIKRFAGEWDPMPFHVDEEMAKLSPIGKLFASSVHTIAIGIRLSHDMMEKDIAVIAGLGWNDLKFPLTIA